MVDENEWKIIKLSIKWEVEKFDFDFVKISQLNLVYHIGCHEICLLISFWWWTDSQLMLKNWFSRTTKETTEKIEGFEIFLMETNLARFHWPLVFFPIHSSSAPSVFVSLPPRLTAPLPPPHSISWLPGHHRAPQCAGGGTRGTHERAFDLFFSHLTLHPDFHLSHSFPSVSRRRCSPSFIFSCLPPPSPLLLTSRADLVERLYRAEWLISVCGGRPKRDVTYSNCEVLSAC